VFGLSRTFRSRLAFVVATLSVLLPAPASAAPFLLDFNALSHGQSNGTVQKYFQTEVSKAFPGATVTVTGALALTDYDADGHVVGPVVGNAVVPMTLGNTDGGTAHGGADAFLVNRGGSDDRIVVEFSFPIYRVEFDLQIFPDATGPIPDFRFVADGVEYVHLFGVLPGTNGTFLHSPFSGPNRVEPVGQLLTHLAFDLPGVTRLEFIDWPERIGIDNLRVFSANVTAVVPEPASLAVWLAGAGFLVAGLSGRRTGRSRSPVAGS